MPDSPDYSKYNPGSVRFSLQDMGELAARLGSHHIYDRRGELIFYDNFSSGIQSWSSFAAGGGGSVAINADYSYMSSYSALLTCGTAPDKNAQMTRYVDLYQLTSLGLEVAVSPSIYLTAFDILMSVADGSTNVDFGFRFDVKNKKLYYKNSSGSFTLLYTFPTIQINTGLFKLMKMVVDFQTGTYKRLMFGEKHFDDLSYEGKITSPSTNRSYLITINAEHNEATVQKAYVGHVIITANEP